MRYLIFTNKLCLVRLLIFVGIFLGLSTPCQADENAKLRLHPSNRASTLGISKLALGDICHHEVGLFGIFIGTPAMALALVPLVGTLVSLGIRKKKWLFGWGLAGVIVGGLGLIASTTVFFLERAFACFFSRMPFVLMNAGNILLQLAVLGLSIYSLKFSRPQSSMLRG